MSGGATVTMLAFLASGAGSAAQIAINNEIRALTTGTPPLLPRGQAVDILTDLRDTAQAANNTAFVAILDSQLAVLSSGDPATAIFNGLNPTTSFTDLETAASQLAPFIASGSYAAVQTAVVDEIATAYVDGLLGSQSVISILAAAGANQAALVNRAGRSGTRSAPRLAHRS